MLREELRQLLLPTVEDLGYELWELEFAPRASGGLLRLYIDTDRGVTLDDCERVSRAVGEVLDAEDPIPGRYTLEVSSPGLDRILRTVEHFERCAGERIKVELTEPLAGRRRFEGRLLGVAESTVELEIDGQRVALPIEGILKARVVPQF